MFCEGPGGQVVDGGHCDPVTALEPEDAQSVQRPGPWIAFRLLQVFQRRKGSEALALQLRSRGVGCVMLWEFGLSFVAQLALLC